ncbi:hypothetical protein BGZ67_006489 [Mortierella alpina]|nr:hypothetical protein BGZ67_006489 [Mortierella alpina]
MSALGESSASELAKRYQEKAQARKRGAGSHQPKFRGFSLKTLSDKADTAADGSRTASKNAESSKTRATRQLKLTKPQETTNDTEKNPSAPNDGAALKDTGLTERYQERFKARVRGTGAHQPGFRGFSLKTAAPSTDQKEKRRLSRQDRTAVESAMGTRSNKDNRQDKQEAAAARNMTSRPSTAKADKSRSALNTRDTHPTERSASMRRTRPDTSPAREQGASSRQSGSAPSSSGATQTPVTSRTRSASRQSGVSPGFKIAWGKKTTVITSETSRRSGDMPQRTTTPEPNGALQSTYEDDMPEYNDFDQRQMPSPGHDDEEVQGAPADAAESIQRREPSRNKRKPAPPTLAPETAINGKRGGVSSKKRRIINEETDENEDPLSITETQGVDHSKASAGKSARKARGIDNAAPTKPTKAVPSSRAAPTKVSKTSKEALSKETSGPLRQTTLMQLSSKSGQNSSSQGQDTAPEADQSDSDFTSSMARSSRHVLSVKADRTSTKKKATASQKGPSDKTVKNYKQLQIHCLKFWGPTTAVSRPATVSNQTIARQLPVEGEAPTEQDGVPQQKLVQGILQVEEAPLSEMDVIAEAVRDTVDQFIESIEEQAIAKDILAFRSELETALIEQVDLLDDHSLLRASVKKASALKKELRVRLLEAQRGRQRTRVKLQRVRSDFEREERARRHLEETHKFLTDLETLREEVEGFDNDQEDDRLSSGQKDHAKTGLHSLIATVGSRCRGGSASVNAISAPSGMLGTLVDFNRTLEAVEKTVREMPGISKSQEVTSSNWNNDLGVSDDSDY